MGNWNLGFYNADHAIQLDWLAPRASYVDVSTSGSYSPPWYGIRAAGLKALKIKRGINGDNSFLFVESRQNRGIYDSTLPAVVHNGALIHYDDYQTDEKSHLLDFTPGSSDDDFLDAPLGVEQAWSDPYSNLAIKGRQYC